MQVPKLTPEVWLCPGTEAEPSARLPSPTPVCEQRLWRGGVGSNTRLTFSLLLNIFTFLWVAVCTKKHVILVLYNSTFLVDCCVEICENYLRKGLYCINKFFVKLWTSSWNQHFTSLPLSLSRNLRKGVPSYFPTFSSSLSKSKDLEWSNSVWQKNY